MIDWRARNQRIPYWGFDLCNFTPRELIAKSGKRCKWIKFQYANRNHRVYTWLNLLLKCLTMASSWDVPCLPFIWVNGESEAIILFWPTSFVQTLWKESISELMTKSSSEYLMTFKNSSFRWIIGKLIVIQWPNKPNPTSAEDAQLPSSELCFWRNCLSSVSLVILSYKNPWIYLLDF